MDINIIRLLFDTGLFVLIWIVQLIIYPSFLFYKKENLLQWHKKYTASISYVVIPLMIGQLVIGLQQMLVNFNTFTSIYFLLILCNWSVTFSIFVPLHSKISNEIYEMAMLKKLVSCNWIRTVLWTLMFMISIYAFLRL